MNFDDVDDDDIDVDVVCEGHYHPDALLEALSPLKRIRHKTVACLGELLFSLPSYL
jgi:hypothetical protein